MSAMKRYSPSEVIGVLNGYGFKRFNGYRDPELPSSAELLLSPKDELIVLVMPDEDSDDYVPEVIINDLCEEFGIPRFSKQ